MKTINTLVFLFSSILLFSQTFHEVNLPSASSFGLSGIVDGNSVLTATSNDYYWVCPGKFVETYDNSYGLIVYLESGASFIDTIIGWGNNTIYARNGSTVNVLSQGNTIYYESQTNLVNTGVSGNQVLCSPLHFNYDQVPNVGCPGQNHGTPTKLHEYTTKKLRLFPNPVNNVLNVECLQCEVIVFDLTGNVVLSKKSAMGSVSTEKLPQGIYKVTLIQGSKTETGSFIKN